MPCAARGFSRPCVSPGRAVERRDCSVLTLRLRDDEVRGIQDVATELAKEFPSVESEGFLRTARSYADEIPRSVRSALYSYRNTETDGLVVISGIPIDDDAVGPTPADWRDERTPSPTLREDIAFFLLGSLLGEAIGWATQQDGRIMHDIFPMKGHEHEQIGSGSSELLTWHTEDAYHPLRTDYLGLMCLRNHEGVETTAAEISEVQLDDQTRDLLFEERFFILPDKSHRAQNQNSSTTRSTRSAALLQRSYERVEELLRKPEPVAVLFGDPRDPYLRIDPFYMENAQGEVEQEALGKVIDAVDAAMSGVVLRPGDICFIDNYRVVHGRKPFQARFDGTDRWLRRLNITRDLRKSRGSRLDAQSRVIY
nr:guanitoxin biosynthesis L-enduracididine beta-hydroxylase GntD [Actinoalloteichus caeruleus]